MKASLYDMLSRVALLSLLLSLAITRDTIMLPVFKYPTNYELFLNFTIHNKFGNCL